MSRRRCSEEGIARPSGPPRPVRPGDVSILRCNLLVIIVQSSVQLAELSRNFAARLPMARSYIRQSGKAHPLGGQVSEYSSRIFAFLSCILRAIIVHLSCAEVAGTAQRRGGGVARVKKTTLPPSCNYRAFRVHFAYIDELPCRARGYVDSGYAADGGWALAAVPAR